jgi:putative flippase GtrA
MTTLASKILAQSHSRWFIVGCLTFVIDTSVFLGLYHLTKWAVLSNILSGTLATIFNYVSHYHWSFVSNRAHRQSTFFYLVFFLAFLALNTSIVRILIKFGMNPLFSKVLTAAGLAPLSFLSMKFLTFRRKLHD